ncbi:hypothetical protein BCR32DRAFT_287256 [Anaeromyces robustus]|uniref:Ankyrin n=1 Tax=Anaeromyces robustus TaxID=1754192 RepID=A0A1Y1VSE1_9FUNG|nr:hypothetical protein BCR32DRAFT_287256 [Anaeromyces robustus]|eukprot:ORX64199.1 hypothetical protein BCR32DRAFT_287256 [Anaeromyces robustus]
MNINSNIKFISQLLSKYKISIKDINCQYKGLINISKYAICQSGYENIIKYLIEYGANINKENK